MTVFGKNEKKYIIIISNNREAPELQMFEAGSDSACLTVILDRDKINNGRFVEAVSNALAGSTEPENYSGTAVFVLPAFLYSFDYITLPTLNRSKMADAFKAEARTMYKNYSDLILNSQVVSQGKVTTTYRIILTQKNILTALKDEFSKKGISVVSFVPYTSACVAGAGKTNALYRKTPSLLLLTSYGQSEVIINGKDTILGQYSIPFGYEVLRSDRVSEETLLYYEKNAELAVINSREKARATKLTMAINIESEHIDDSIPEDTAEVKTPEQPAEGDAETAVNADGEDEYGETTVEKQQTQNVKTATKRVTRILPKFMRRPVPEDANGFILENFRLFEKRLLLTARECRYTEYLPVIENIWLSLPDEYAFIAEVVGADSDNTKAKWENLLFGKDKTQNKMLLTGATAAKGSKLPRFTL